MATYDIHQHLWPERFVAALRSRTTPPLLSRDELSEYIQHRCTIAGAKKLPFDTGALEALHEISRGNLRAADGLALTALVRASRSKKTVVGAQHVAEARQELYP